MALFALIGSDLIIVLDHAVFGLVVANFILRANLSSQNCWRIYLNLAVMELRVYFSHQRFDYGYWDKRLHRLFLDFACFLHSHCQKRTSDYSDQAPSKVSMFLMQQPLLVNFYQSYTYPAQQLVHLCTLKLRSLDGLRLSKLRQFRLFLCWCPLFFELCLRRLARTFDNSA